MKFTLYFQAEDGREITLTAPRFKRWVRGAGNILHKPSLPAVVITNVHVRVGDEIPEEGNTLPPVPLIAAVQSLLTVMTEQGYWSQEDTDVAHRAAEIITACGKDCDFDPSAEENPYLEAGR